MLPSDGHINREGLCREEMRKFERALLLTLALAGGSILVAVAAAVLVVVVRYTSPK